MYSVRLMLKGRAGGWILGRMKKCMGEDRSFNKEESREEREEIGHI